jgi:hypothetical protein
MGRRQGTVDDRVLVAVSKSMAALRQTQGVLNGFWQTSELAYGYLLTRSATDFPDLTRPTAEALGHIQSEVWYPNNQGRIKRRDTIGETLQQVRDNTTHVYRAALLSFFSAFEVYLDTEVEQHKPPNVTRWGEYVRSLASPSLRFASCPLPLRTVLCADFCREVRNQLVHESFSVPTSVTDGYLPEWKQRLYKRACAAGWSPSEATSEVDYAFHQVIGQAVDHVQQAKASGKDLPIVLFYMLFSFTNLDSLAFAIEEALQPPGARPGGRVSRKQAVVRRADLILAPAA